MGWGVWRGVITVCSCGGKIVSQKEKPKKQKGIISVKLMDSSVAGLAQGASVSQRPSGSPGRSEAAV